MHKIPWWQPKVEKEDYAYVKEALDRNFINEGPLVEQFERDICARTGSKHAVATTSCTAAMFLSLRTLGIGHGDEVLVPDITFIATANAVTLSGATPVLVDVDENLTIDLGAAHKAITTKTKAIIPVHVSGRSADMEAMSVFAQKHRLFVIEDAAEAIGSTYNGKQLGTFGTMGCLSFAANKTIATGQGGMVLTGDDSHAESLRALRNQGRKGRGTGGDDIHDRIGFNFRMTDLQGGVGLGQLAHLDERLTRMKRNYELYIEQLGTMPELRIYPVTSATEIPQWTDIELEKRDELEAYLREKGIDCRKYWLPLHKQRAYQLPDQAFPNATRLSPRSLWLPSAFTLTDEDIVTVSEEIREFFAKK